MTTLTTTQKSVGVSFWLAWLFATTIGIVVFVGAAIPIGYGAGEAVMQIAGETVGMSVTGAVFGLAIGAGLGVPQALILQPRIGRAGGWAMGSLGGGVIAGAVSLPLAFAFFGQTPATAIVGFSLMGLCMSLGQWLAIRGQIPRAGWWVLAGAMSIAVGLAVGVLLGGEGRELLSLSVTGAVAGALTGGAMLALLRQPR